MLTKKTQFSVHSALLAPTLMHKARLHASAVLQASSLLKGQVHAVHVVWVCTLLLEVLSALLAQQAPTLMHKACLHVSAVLQASS